MRAKINLALLILLAACIGASVTMRAWEGRGWETARLIPRGSGERLYSPAPERFRSGESLTYRVSWSTFATAATANISIPERLYFFGDDVWSLRAQVSTVNPVRRLFTIDDQFTSYSDVNTLQSRQYVMKLDELGRKRVEQFRSSLTGPGNTGGFGAIPAGAFDPLGALFLLRTVDWEQSVAAEIFDGKQIYEMIAQRTGEETVSVPAGKFRASRIRVDLQAGNDGTSRAASVSVTIWLATDASRTPVAIQVALIFGTLRLELTSLQAVSSE